MQSLLARRRRAGGRSMRPSQLAVLFRRLCNPADMHAHFAVAAVLILLEAGLCAFIIYRVPYTEIDYTTYLQQVDGFEQGERDYQKLGGDTGPLVYPAGHLYIYSLIRRCTGGSIRAAQAVFAGLYLATQAVVMLIYAQSRAMPPWSLGLLCLSRRLHSIYLLRLFNDCWAMFLAYCATALLQRRKWVLSVLLYSLATSVKMNVLLMAPGVLAVMLTGASLGDLLAAVAAGGVLQAALGAPFLLHNPASYMAKAFEFSRVFLFKWTVNWKFVPEPWFVNPRFGALLLALHVRLLWTLVKKQWFPDADLSAVLRAFLTRPWRKRSIANTQVAPGDVAGSAPGATAAAAGQPSPEAVAKVVFSSNFVGVLCARTLHYQFYSWYFHSLPFLLLRSPCPTWQAVGILAGIEVVWNLYPPTPITSAILFALHCLTAAYVLLGEGRRGKKPKTA